MQWFKRHPDFLRDESTKLSNDSNYKEIAQFRDNLFLSHGNIVVRLGKIYRHPILIVYPEATPYQLPLVFPLKCELEKGEIEKLASGTIAELVKAIEPKIEFYYEHRHQNGGGSLCIVEWDNLDDGSIFYGITSILKRLRDWYAGHVIGAFPMDNLEVEYCAHFVNVHTKINFLYPDGFLEKDLIAGQFYGTLIADNTTSIYYGGLIDGISASGIYKSDSPYLFTQPINEKLRTSADFQTHPDLVESLITKKQLINGIWFHVDSTLVPFAGFENLIKIIGNNSFLDGINRFVKTASNFFKKLHDEFFVGVRYPNKRGDLEFQLFKVHIKKDLPAYEMHTDPVAKMKATLNRYDLVEAIPGEKLAPQDYHARNSTRADFNILSNADFNIFGVGALGSEIADCLGKAGVGNLLLVDNQQLKPHNAVRHLAGLSYVGIEKTKAVKEILKDHNPFIDVQKITGDLFVAHELMYVLPEDSVTVSALASDNLEGFVNEHAVIAGKTMFYSRALRGGKAARIFRVIPGKDACFQCLNLYINEGRPFLKIPEDKSFPIIKNECNNPIRPASAADLKLIAAMASRKIIEHLQQGESEFNHWIWSSEPLAEVNINSPFTMTQDFLPPHTKCYYCNHDQQLKVCVTDSALDSMKKLVQEKSGIETGGVLAGHVDIEGNIVIAHASGPGPKAVHKKTEFRKDVVHCQDFLDKLFIESARKTVYVGEWHSHPESNNSPSGLDIKSLSDIAVQKEYLTTTPTMIIFSSAGDPSCTVHPAGKRHYFVNLEIIK